MKPPPPLIPFAGDWPTYEEEVYQAFLESFVRARVTFRGIPVKAQRHPEYRGKGFGFWHLISEARDPKDRCEANRIPDLERCKRIRWIAWAIEEASAGQPGFSWWENERKGEKRVVIWAEEHDYAVVLAVRKGYYLLKTAFYGIKPHRRRAFEAERAAYWQAQKTEAPQRLRRRASAAPSTMVDEPNCSIARSTPSDKGVEGGRNEGHQRMGR